MRIYNPGKETLRLRVLRRLPNIPDKLERDFILPPGWTNTTELDISFGEDLGSVVFHCDGRINLVTERGEHAT